MKDLFKKVKAPQKGTGCNFMVFVFAIIVWAGYELLHPFLNGLF
jgi:multisubunit Na+/H+ antiporter MnhG subunit